MRVVSLVLAIFVLSATLAFADPGVRVEYHSGIPQITLEGNYAASRYTVQRSAVETGPYAPISAVNVLCVGACFVDDHTAVPGRTYWYRFDVEPANGAPSSYGPYPITIAAPYPGSIHAKVFPNPSLGPASFEVYLLGAAADAPLEIRATLLDLQGRRVREVFRGPLPRGTSVLAWNGRNDRGILVPGGQYFLRVTSPIGASTIRVIRAH